MKGITPVVAIILLLLITISMVGFAFVFFTRTTETVAKESDAQLLAQLKNPAMKIQIEAASSSQISVRNIGSHNIPRGAVAVLVDGIPSGCDFGDISVNEVRTCSFSCSGQEVRVTAPGNADSIKCPGGATPASTPTQRSLSLTANPASVPADGASTSTIEARTSDTINGIVVSFSSSRAAVDTFSPTSCTTAANGACSVTVRSSTDGSSVITGAANGYTSGIVSVSFMIVASPVTKRVFLTSDWLYIVNAPSGRRAFSSLQQAHDICRDFANAAGLTSTGTWRAWLSTSSVNAKDTIFGPAGDWGYKRLDNVPVAHYKEDLLDGSIENPICVYENGNSQCTVGSGVWTGTKRDGTSSTQTCNDWTSNSFEHMGMMGSSTGTNFVWTETGASSCNSGGRLYCFEV